jgi:cytochrome c oxidase accessory protein FixG
VTYEAWRGEPRGKYRKGEGFDGRGDCIDCRQCVAVCPMGIDIRDGFQMECIGCGLCIDACDDVMERIGRPKRLIAYDSERNQELRSAGQPPVYRIFRPRTLLYLAILAGVGLVMLSVLLLRSTVDVNILPDRNPLFVTMADGSIRNGYTIRVMNKEHATKSYGLGSSQADAHLAVQGVEGSGRTVSLTAPPDGVATYHVFVHLPRTAVPADRNELELTLEDLDTGAVTTYETVFRGPKR